MSDTGSSNVAAGLRAGWRLVRIRRIEDLGDAVLGAGLDALQLSREPVTGSLAFSTGGGVVLSSGYLRGKVSLVGPLSQRDITLGVGLNLSGGTRHWLQEVSTGNVGVFRPGGEHDAIYADGSLYLTLTLSEDRLMEEAESEGLILEPAIFRQSGVHPRSFSSEMVDSLRRSVAAAHLGATADATALASFRRRALAIFIEHLGRPPFVMPGLSPIRGQERIVARARAYIDAHLDEPLNVNEIATAAAASRRSLYRAFLHVLEESPQAYVTRLRLHRIRSDLVRTASGPRVTEASNRWGIGELGRMSGRYKALFGELPSQTIRLKQEQAAALGQLRA
jgi:AraC-like DNA-binding protein